MANIEKSTEEFNKLRIENQGKTFTHVQMRDLLAKAKIPYTRVKILSELGAIINPSRGCYTFPTIPVYKSIIEKYYEQAYKESKEDYDNRKPENVQKMTIEEAIQVLKESGEYQIYKKVIQWEEVK